MFTTCFKKSSSDVKPEKPRKPASGFSKMGILSKKNLLIQWRHPVLLAMDLLLPIIITCILVTSRGLFYTPPSSPNSKADYEVIANETDEDSAQPNFIYIPHFADSKAMRKELQMELLVPFALSAAYMFFFVNLLRKITTDNENNVRESLKIMGIRSFFYWLSWLATVMTIHGNIMPAIAGQFLIPFGENGKMFKHTDFPIITMLLNLYIQSVITFAMLLSTFFKSVKKATIFGIGIWFALLFPYNLIATYYDHVGLGWKLLTCVFCNSGFGLGWNLIMKSDEAGIGIGWSNLFSGVTPDDNLSLGLVLLVLLVTANAQFFLSMYVEKLRSGDYGVPEKWSFIFKSSFWRSKKAEELALDDISTCRNSSFEEVPNDKPAGIQVRGLRKVVDYKVLLDNLTLDMHEDQITVLLGDLVAANITLAMLTGMQEPSAGNFHVETGSFPIGFCPPHNILFNELTVKEHIAFFCKLRGMKKDEIKEQIAKYTDLLDLSAELNSQSHTLSREAKRSLTLCNALCGESKVVLVDQPTCGVEPGARKALWDLLISEKKGRTILLTTNFMDEADAVGDRIAILAEGKLKAVCSSFFVQEKLGTSNQIPLTLLSTQKQVHSLC